MTASSTPSPTPASAVVVLGVGGGIAAYKACEVLRRIRADDTIATTVTVVPTANALKFVGVATFEALSGQPVSYDVFSDIPQVAHVATGQHADLVVLAPATADLLARAAAGRADDMLTATLLMTRAPVLMAPAMHTEMWTHPATVANVATLRQRGVIVLDPAVGRLTGADSGPGRLPEPDHISDLAALLLRRPTALPYDLAGRQIVVTAGGTREALDPVRFLSNSSSGRQGFAIALVAAARGAEVTLIAANTSLATPPGVRRVDITSAAELAAATATAATEADAVIMAAAVADFRPAQHVETKIKKSTDSRPAPIELVENPDILAGLVSDRGSNPSPYLIGFAAETGDESGSVIEYGQAKLARKGCDAIVINDVSGGQAFGTTDNAATIMTAAGEVREIARGPKALIGAAVCDLIAAS